MCEDRSRLFRGVSDGSVAFGSFGSVSSDPQTRPEARVLRTRRRPSMKRGKRLNGKHSCSSGAAGMMGSPRRSSYGTPSNGRSLAFRVNAHRMSSSVPNSWSGPAEVTVIRVPLHSMWNGFSQTSVVLLSVSR